MQRSQSSENLPGFVLFPNRCLWVLIVASFLLAIGARAQTVEESYEKARQSYLTGRIRESLRQLLKVVEEHPHHHPSRAMLGQAAYRMGRISLATKHFRRVEVGRLTDLEAIDYGLSFYTADDCQTALRGFLRVRSYRRNIARYYAGDCYFKLGEFQRAKGSLREAGRLPLRLSLSRRKLMRKMKRQSMASKAGSSPVQIDPLATPSGGNASSPPPQPWLFASSPRLQYTRIDQESRFHGFKEDYSTSNAVAVGANGSVDYQRLSRVDGKPWKVGLHMDINHETADRTGRTDTLFRDADEPQIVFRDRVNKIPVSSRLLSLSGGPHLEVPLAVWATGKGEATWGQDLPDVDPSKKQTSQTLKGSLALSADEWSGGSSVSMTESRNHEDAWTGTSTFADGTVSFASEGYTLKLYMTWDQIVYPTDQKGTGPTSTTAGEFSLSRALNLGLSLTATVRFAQIASYHAKAVAIEGSEDETADIDVSGDEIGFRGGLRVDPTAWLSGGVEYSTVTRRFIVSDPSLIKGFQQQNADQVISWTIDVGVSWQF